MSATTFTFEEAQLLESAYDEFHSIFRDTSYLIRCI